MRRLVGQLAILGALCVAPAAAEPVPEHDLKAAFVFNFALFTEWPGDVLAPGAPLRVCATPGTALASSLDRLDGKLVNGHPVLLAHLAGAAPRQCHIIVLGRHDRERWAQIRRELSGASVLTVSDDIALGADGAVIAMSVEFERVGFDVDAGAARAARLAVSSKLLRLARRVR
jgi:hypothetical protein